MDVIWVKKGRAGWGSGLVGILEKLVGECLKYSLYTYGSYPG